MLKDIVDLIEIIFKSDKSKESLKAADTLVKDTVAIIKNNAASQLEIPEKTDKQRDSDEPLLESFNNMSDEDKILLLHSALRAHRNDITIRNHEQKLARDMVIWNLRAWLLKVFILFTATVGLLAIASFIFLIVKNGTASDATIVGSFFKSLDEVLHVIFSEK